MKLIRTAFGWFAGSHSWWLLLAVAAAGAALYAWGAEQRAEVQRLTGWANTVCASAGAELAPPNGRRGVACAAAIRDLTAFKRDSATETSRLLQQALRDQAAKTSADLGAARAAAADARAAANMMEKANAQIGPDDRVARDWFVALNRTGGLRAPAR